MDVGTVRRFWTDGGKGNEQDEQILVGREEGFFFCVGLGGREGERRKGSVDPRSGLCLSETKVVM